MIARIRVDSVTRSTCGHDYYFVYVGGWGWNMWPLSTGSSEPARGSCVPEIMTGCSRVRPSPSSSVDAPFRDPFHFESGFSSSLDTISFLLFLLFYLLILLISNDNFAEFKDVRQTTRDITNIIFEIFCRCWTRGRRISFWVSVAWNSNPINRHRPFQSGQYRKQIWAAITRKQYDKPFS